MDIKTTYQEPDESKRGYREVTRTAEVYKTVEGDFIITAPNGDELGRSTTQDEACAAAPELVIAWSIEAERKENEFGAWLQTADEANAREQANVDNEDNQ